MTSDWRRPLDESLRDAYLVRLGWDSPPRPSLGTLRALHRSHVERVPYEVVWIALGESRTIDPLDSVHHVVAGRGGYCYHLNGAFGALLDWLGFDVQWHAGGVQRHGQEPRGASGNHLALEVRALPTGESPAGAWYIDVGLGDGLHEPLPLVAGSYRQPPYALSLRVSDIVIGGWRFDHDARGSFVGLDFAPGEASLADLTSRHRKLSICWLGLRADGHTRAPGRQWCRHPARPPAQPSRRTRRTGHRAHHRGRLVRRGRRRV
ncbi:MAG: arylamine N-acetyltransferase [Actinomycetota bacterium]|nr:arylamine N-acetyltransferase [Actinomycetota bacterium]